ncbi:unnamed protein product [Didymodactylos carnosus]|uniref:Uncharacterized protein n=1 Tax=Didymodactylos carnosus TaxID=1234261 RepID=A0A8S2ZB72_9BILA|nr:unnamed protein product [Didymodactylos carnosus]
MVNDEIDPAFSRLDVCADDGKIAEATSLIKAFDRIIGDTRTIAQTAVDITKAKLAILGYTTGNQYPILIKQWSCQNSLEDLHNPFCYMALSRVKGTRPQQVLYRLQTGNVLSTAQVLDVCHLFGGIEY